MWQGKNDASFLAHLETKDHLEAEEYYGSDPELDELPEDYLYHCTACSKKMATLDNWTKHVAGKKHRHQMDLKMMKYKECPLCNVVFTGRQHMQDHIEGRKHHVSISSFLNLMTFSSLNGMQNKEYLCVVECLHFYTPPANCRNIGGAKPRDVVLMCVLASQNRMAIIISDCRSIISIQKNFLVC